MALIEFSAFAVIVVIIVVIALLMKKLLVLVVNSVIGFFALFATKLLVPSLDINFWSVIITAIGGIIGYAVVLILHFTGLAF